MLQFIIFFDYLNIIFRLQNFPTSHMEMNAVANMFDGNNEDYIDWKEFLAALRPDWEDRTSHHRRQYY